MSLHAHLLSLRKRGRLKGRSKIAKALGEFKRGRLRAGSKKGPIVKKRSQALAIAMSEQKEDEHREGVEF